MQNIDQIVEISLLLLGILASCLVFANAVEHIGEKFALGKQMTGSILAAVGTALPETIVPVIAIIMAAQGVNASAKNDIAVGSIIGAPFLLGTLALFLVAITVILFRKSRGTTVLEVNVGHLRRDLYFFLFAFTLVLLAFVVPTLLKVAIAISLGMVYATYLFVSIRESKEASDAGHDGEVDLPDLYFNKIGLPDNIVITIMQAATGLIGIIFMAEKFVHTLEHVSEIWGISPLILSLIITPIATELPEKVNSCIWSSQKKDILAMGNITGAMVFQASIPCAIGILFTPWEITEISILCAALTLLSAMMMLGSILLLKKLEGKVLLFGGLLYLIYIYAAFFA